jgi:hypothetical protein
MNQQIGQDNDKSYAPSPKVVNEKYIMSGDKGRTNDMKKNEGYSFANSLTNTAYNSRLSVK